MSAVPPADNPAGRQGRFRFRLIVEEEYRSPAVVPAALWVFTAILLAGQILLNGFVVKEPIAKAESLEDPPSSNFLAAVSLGSPLPLSRMLMFRLQAFDNQPGISLPYMSLDYQKIRGWLEVIQEMNPSSAYPLLTAARVYSEVRDPRKKRVMFDFVRQEFLKDPNSRWEWMAHVTIIAKENLKDLDLALSYAREIRELTDPKIVPGWARQMEVFFRESRSEYDTSIRLLEQLLESGEVSDQHEFTFLFDRLAQLIEKAWQGGQIKDEAELDAKLQKLDELRERYLDIQDIGDRV